MKKLLAMCVFIGGICVASEDPDMPEPGLVKEIYDWCIDNNEPESSGEGDVLYCVNEDLTYSGYQTFSSLQAVKDYIKDL